MATPKPKRGLTAAQAALKWGFRSGLEERIALQLDSFPMGYTYETLTLPYTSPPKDHKYHPDFILDNGIIVETKGRLLTADRQKMVLVKQQHPNLDIRFVFSNSKTKINKRSPTSYGDWASKNGFPYSDKTIPTEWLKEPKKNI
jgi:hypothetical protein